MKSYLDITYRYIKIQGRRTMMTIIGIILSTALITGIGNLGVSFWNKMIRDTISAEGDYHLQITAMSPESLEAIQDYISVKQVGLRAYKGRGGVNLIKEEKLNNNYFNYYDLNAYDKNALEMLPIKLDAGRMPENSTEIILGDDTLPYLKKEVDLGDIIPFEVQDENGNVISVNTYQVVGIFDTKKDNAKNAQAITAFDKEQNQKYTAYVKFDGNRNIKERSKILLSDLQLADNLNCTVIYNEALLRFLFQSNNNAINMALISSFMFLALIVALAMSAVIYNAFNIAVSERMTQYGLYRCLGSTPGQVKRLVFKEAGLMSIIGIPIGIILGMVAIKALLILLRFLVPDLPYGDLKLIFSPYIILISVALSLIAVYISAYSPAKKASKVSPIEAIRNTGGSEQEKLRRVSKGNIAKIFFKAEGWIAEKNLSRNRKRLVITVFSLVISISLFIVFGSLVNLTNQVGVTGNMDEVFHFQIGGYDDNGGIKISKEDIDELRNMQDVKRVYEYYRTFYDETKDDVIVTKEQLSDKLVEFNQDWIQNHTTEGGEIHFDRSHIVALGDQNLNVLDQNIVSGEINVDKMNEESGVIVVNKGYSYNASTQRKTILEPLNVNVGDTIQVAVCEGDQKIYKDCKVQAVVSKGLWGDSSNEYGGLNVYTTDEVYKSLTNANKYPNFIVVQMEDKASDEAKYNVKQYLEHLISKYGDYILDDRDAEMREAKQYNLVLNIFVYGFFIIIAMIGCVNILNTISTNILLRKKELSILRAIGMDKKGLNKLVNLESIFYGIIAIVLGNILGCILSYTIYKLFYGAMEIEWVVPWANVIIASAATLFITFIAGYIPLKRINDMIIVEGIRGAD